MRATTQPELKLTRLREQQELLISQALERIESIQESCPDILKDLLERTMDADSVTLEGFEVLAFVNTLIVTTGIKANQQIDKALNHG